MVGYEGLRIWKTCRTCENEPKNIPPAGKENTPFLIISFQPSIATFCVY